MITQHHPAVRNSTRTIILLYLLAIATVLIYWAGLPGVFILDDITNLQALNTNGGVTNTHTFMSFVFGNHSGPTGRPVSMLSFLINDQYWPGSAGAYKKTNILLHVLCGLLIFLLLYKVGKALNLQEIDAQTIALVSTGLWLLHPLHVSTTLYVIQRMVILMTLFCTCAIIFYLYLRNTDLYKQRKTAASLTIAIIIFGSLGVLSKENGVLLLFFILAIEVSISNTCPRPKNMTYWLAIFIVLPVIILASYFIINWSDVLSGYTSRNFTITERLLSEARILMSYLGQIIIPRNAGTGLFHDHITVSSGLFSPATTSLAIAAIIFLLYSAYILRKRQPVYSFAVFWYFSAHLMESTFIPLELYFEHRNYMAMIGPLFAIVYYLFYASSHVKRQELKRLLKPIPAGMILLFAMITYQSTSLWGNPLSLFAIWAYENPTSIRSQLLYARQLNAFGKHTQALETLQTIYAKFPHDLTLPLHIIDISCQHHIPQNTDDLLKINDQSILRGGLIHPLKKIVGKEINKSCVQLSSSSLHHYLDKLITTPSVSKHNKISATILNIHAKYYITERNLSKAMQLLDMAFERQPSVDIAIHQTVLLYSAGLYQEANTYLEKAMKVDSNRKPFISSRKRELDIIKRDITTHLSK